MSYNLRHDERYTDDHQEFSVDEAENNEQRGSETIYCTIRYVYQGQYKCKIL